MILNNNNKFKTLQKYTVLSVLLLRCFTSNDAVADFTSASADTMNSIQTSLRHVAADNQGEIEISGLLPNDIYKNANQTDGNSEIYYQENRLLPSLDSSGLKQDAYYFFGYQFFVIGVLYVSPESVSGWSEEQKKNFTIEKYKHNTRQMIWDRDKFYINYVLHPYWGMAYYVRARERGATHVGSFWYAELLSTLWEFGVEALFEEVSIQDLFVTPIMGAVIGKYVDTYRQKVKAKDEKNSFDNFMMGFTDPLGAANRSVSRLFGKNASVSFSYSVLNTPSKLNNKNTEQDTITHVTDLSKYVSPALGFTFNYRF